jgi:hypothetical protein
MRTHVFAAVVCVLGFGCGSTVDPATDTVDGGAESGSGVTREQACTDAIHAICGQYQKCIPLIVSVGFGDEATCESRLKSSCNDAWDAPGSTSTPDKVDSCAKSIEKVTTCDALGASTPECSAVPGTLADGAGCTGDAQCKSTWCAKNDEATCGKCTKITAAGDPCVDTGKKADGTSDKKCSSNLTCNAKGTCVKAAAKGESCSADAQPCALSLACFGGKCVEAGKAGAKCDPAGTTDPPCDFAQGVFCNPVDKVCKLFQYAKAGESCGVVGTDYKICVAGAKCSVDGAGTGTCVAPAADGSPCDLTKKIGCLSPAQCEGGTCKLPSASSCK